MIDGSLIDNIRYTINKYYALFGLPANQFRRPTAICQAIADDTGDLSVDRRPIRNLLLNNPLDGNPTDLTIDRVIKFIIDRGPSNDGGPIIRPEWFRQSHDDNFIEKITGAFREGERLNDLAVSYTQRIQPTQKYSSQFEELAHFIAGTEYGEQALAKSFVGHYLIFRHIVSLEDWAVSYMIIHPPRQNGDPCWFETHSPPNLDTYNEDEEVVCGVFFEPPTRPRIFHSIGRHLEKDGQDQWCPTLELRSAYLQGVRRPSSNGGPRDMSGVRLGPGRVYGEPRGYAMWCARLTENISPDDLSSLVAQFPMSDATKIDVYRPFIPSLDFVLDWVFKQGYLSVR